MSHELSQKDISESLLIGTVRYLSFSHKMPHNRKDRDKYLLRAQITHYMLFQVLGRRISQGHLASTITILEQTLRPKGRPWNFRKYLLITVLGKFS